MKQFKVESILQSEHTQECCTAYSRILTVISETGYTQIQISFPINVRKMCQS